MGGGHVITLRNLTKRYGDKIAVNDVSLDIAPGKVTGFLGPNGAGKSTTMRVVLGLDHPTAGEALVDGRPYTSLRYPLREVGALLDAKAAHPGRSARKHLMAMARSNGISTRRVDEVLAKVGLTEVTRKRAGAFSLGMSQRLGIAGALLGDPRVLIFDEPVNGLDADGVRWVRKLMRSLAAEGRTVFVSSHLMSEMQQTAEHLVIIGRGKIIADAPMDEVIAKGSRNAVRVRSPRRDGLDTLQARLADQSVEVDRVSPHELLVPGSTVEHVGNLAHEIGVPLDELSLRQSSLEEAYLELTADSVEFVTAGDSDPGGGPANGRAGSDYEKEV
jgi:ABC-2 type transport system ATP-binding protein